MRSVVALGVVAASLGCGFAAAQTAPAPRFERNPLYPTPVSIYGRVSLGALKGDSFEPTSGQRETGRLQTLERSHFGIRATETLDYGMLAHFQLEHSFKANDGTSAGGESRFFDARVTVGFSHSELGRVDLGLLEQPAVSLLREADPWHGNTSATPGRRGYLPPRDDATRSASSLTYTTPPDWDWHFSLQTGRPEPTLESSYRIGFSLAWDRKPWLAGVGWQAWSDGSRALPLVLVHDSGTLKLGAVVTVGRSTNSGNSSSAGSYKNVFLNASGPLMAKGDPQRWAWRIGLNRYAPEEASLADTKLSAGLRYRISRQVALLVDAAVVHPQNGATRTALDFGLSYSFARDLRWPQEAR